MLVVLAVLAGGVAGQALRVPAGYLVGGLVGGLGAKWFSGIATLPGAGGVAVLGQLLVAYTMVCSADLSAVRSLPRLFPVAVLYAAALTGISLVFAKILEWTCHLDPLTALFAVPPGGLSGLAITGAEMGSNAPVAVLFQLVRMVFVLLIIPAVATWWIKF